MALWNDAGAIRFLGDILTVEGGLTNAPNGFFIEGTPFAMRTSDETVTLYGTTGWRAVFSVARPGQPQPLEGGTMLDERSDFQPRISFSESYRETTARNSTRTTNGNTSIKIVA